MMPRTRSTVIGSISSCSLHALTSPCMASHFVRSISFEIDQFIDQQHQQGSLNLSEFVGGRNGQSTSQILPSWLYWQWLDLTLPARSAPPARRHSVDERSAGIERTRGTLAGCLCRGHETPEGKA